MNTCHSKWLNICLSVACCVLLLSQWLSRLDIVMIAPLIIRVIFSLKQLVCCSFRKWRMVCWSRHKLPRPDVSNIAPRGLCRPQHSRRPASAPEESRGIFFFWLTLIRFYCQMLVCVNAGARTRSFYHHQRIIPWVLPRPGQAGHAAWSPLTVNLHV